MVRYPTTLIAIEKNISIFDITKNTTCIFFYLLIIIMGDVFIFSWDFILLLLKAPYSKNY